MSNLPKSVTINEEVMREGLQIEDKNIPVSEKLRLLDALGETGAKSIVVGSFGSPKWCPQMANIDEVVERFEPKPGVNYLGLAFNQRGVERVQKYYPKIRVAGGGQRTNLELGSTFLIRNWNMTSEQQIAGWPDKIRLAKEQGQEVGQVSVGSPWGGNFEGDIPHERVMKALEMQFDLWHENGFKVTSVAFPDAMGWNTPHRVRRTLEAVRERWPEVTEMRCHFHNTRGVAMASCYEALQAGATVFDTSIGGTGGCPYCGNGRAAGLPPTEDFVFMCEEMGIETGFRLDKLIEAVEVAEQVMGHPLWGHVSKAGPLPRGEKLYPKDLPFVETLEEAAHFRKGVGVVAHQIAPWKEYPDSPTAKLLTDPARERVFKVEG